MTRPAPPPPASRDTALAVGALVSAVVFAPLGIVLGLIALGRARSNGGAGAGLATAAVVLGSLVSVGLLLLAS